MLFFKFTKPAFLKSWCPFGFISTYVLASLGNTASSNLINILPWENSFDTLDFPGDFPAHFPNVLHHNTLCRAPKVASFSRGFWVEVVVEFFDDFQLFACIRGHHPHSNGFGKEKWKIANWEFP